ncbi:hypothetical protein D9M73_232860 [compost metagenome]
MEATNASASAPDSACATTSKWGIADSRAFTPSRTSTWSSISAILMGRGKLIAASWFFWRAVQALCTGISTWSSVRP